MILARDIERGWRQRADLHASLMVPSALLLALLDAVKAGRGMADASSFHTTMRCGACEEALAAWRKVVGE